MIHPNRSRLQVQLQVLLSLAATSLLLACSESDFGPGGLQGGGGESAQGGLVGNTGGTNTFGGAVAGGATGTGGNSNVGGTSATGGSTSGTGGSATGGSAAGGVASGGAATGGASNVGGAATGGKSATGGASNVGGTATGGKTATGGASNVGGVATGGKAATGGASNVGGAATGGKAATGGVGSIGGATGTAGAAGSSCPFVGHVTYTLAKAAAPTTDQQAAYDRITAAMDTAIRYYNCYTDITKVLNVSYVPSVATADGNINGSIRFGSTASMNRVTAMHEISHTVGVGTAAKWASLVVGGKFTGSNALAQLLAIPNRLADTIGADSQHFWPYGLNYESEGKNESDLIGHCQMVVAIRKDLGL